MLFEQGGEKSGLILGSPLATGQNGNGLLTCWRKGMKRKDRGKKRALGGGGEIHSVALKIFKKKRGKGGSPVSG